MNQTKALLSICFVAVLCLISFYTTCLSNQCKNKTAIQDIANVCGKNMFQCQQMCKVLKDDCEKIGSDSNSAIVHKVKADIYRTSGYTELAIHEYREAISKDNSLAAAYVNLGIAYQSKGSTQEAINNYEKGMELSVGKRDPYYDTIYLKAHSLRENALMNRNNVSSYVDSSCFDFYSCFSTTQKQMTFDESGNFQINDPKYLLSAIEYSNSTLCAPQIKDISLAYGYLCYIQIKGTSCENSTNTCDKAIVLDSSNPLFFEFRGESYSCNDEYDKALIDFNKAIELSTTASDTFSINNKIANIYIKKGEKHIRNSEYLLSIDDFTSALNYFINNNDKLRVYAALYNSYILLNDNDKALYYLNKVLEIDSNDYNALSTRGYIYYTMNNYELASADMQHTIELKINDDKAYYYLAELSFAKKEYNKTIEYCNDAFEIISDNDKLHYLRGVSNYMINEYDGALLDLILLTNNATSEFNNVNEIVGDIYFKIGKYALSLYYLNKSLQHNPKIADNESFKAKLSLINEKVTITDKFIESGDSMCDNKHYESAFDYYNKGIAVDSSNPRIYLSIARCKWMQKDYANSIKWAEKSLEQAPTYEEAREFVSNKNNFLSDNYYDNIKEAEKFIKREDFMNAIKKCKTALTFIDTNIEPYIMISVSYYKLQQINYAKEWIVKAEKIDSKDEDVISIKSDIDEYIEDEKRNKEYDSKTISLLQKQLKQHDFSGAISTCIQYEEERMKTLDYCKTTLKKIIKAQKPSAIKSFDVAKIYYSPSIYITKWYFDKHGKQKGYLEIYGSVLQVLSDNAALIQLSGITYEIVFKGVVLREGMIIHGYGKYVADVQYSTIYGQIKTVPLINVQYIE